MNSYHCILFDFADLLYIYGIYNTEEEANEAFKDLIPLIESKRDKFLIIDEKCLLETMKDDDVDEYIYIVHDFNFRELLENYRSCYFIYDCYRKCSEWTINFLDATYDERDVEEFNANRKEYEIDEFFDKAQLNVNVYGLSL